jgi:hypothetical protein
MALVGLSTSSSSAATLRNGTLPAHTSRRPQVAALIGRNERLVQNRRWWLTTAPQFFHPLPRNLLILLALTSSSFMASQSTLTP